MEQKKSPPAKARSARLTPTALALIATGLSIPVALGLGLLDLLVF